MSRVQEQSLEERPQERIKVWRPQGTAGVEVELFDNIPSFDLPPVYFDGYYEFTVARASSYRFRYMNAVHRFSSVDNLFFVQRPGETFSATSRDGLSATARILRLYPELMADMKEALRLKTGLPYFPSMTADENLNAPIAKLATETINAFDGGATGLECESRLLRLMHAVLKHLSDTPPPEVKLGKEHKAVSLVKEVLHAHLEATVKLDDLAALTHLNKFYLLRVFQRDVGMSPHEYQMGLRVNRSKHLLAKGEKPANVAFDLGFLDQAHFTRTFKSYTQTTPGRFQKLSLAS